MTQAELKLKRKRSNLIKTDNKGNLKRDETYRISGTTMRKQGYNGNFKKKLSDETYSEETYKQYCFGGNPNNQSPKVEE